MWLGDKLKKIKNKINLSEERKGEMLADMLRRIDAGTALSHAARERRIIQSPLSKINLFKKMPVFAAILVAALLGGGTSFAAQGSLPGDALYPVKVGFNEKIAEAFQLTPQAKANFESQLAAVRLDEAAKLAAQNKLADNWKNVLEANFKVHADAAQKAIAEINSSGNPVAAASLASNLEGSLRARHDVINQLEGSSTVTLGSEISDTVKLRHEAEREAASSTVQGEEGAKNSAQGKLDAAANSIDSVQAYFDGLNVSSSTLSEPLAKLSDARELYLKAQAKFTAGDYNSSFGLAQDAIRTAEEARISVNLQSDLKLKGPFSVTRHGDDDEGDIEDGGRLNSSSTIRGEEGDDREGGDEGGGGGILNSTTTVPLGGSLKGGFKVNVGGDD